MSLLDKLLEEAFEGKPLPGSGKPKTVLLVAAGAYYIYNQVMERGVFAAVRAHKVDSKIHVDYHVDTDDDKYEGVIDHARLAKDDQKAADHLRRRQTTDDDGKESS